MFRSEIIGHGYYLPENTMSNDQVIEQNNLETDDDWIVKRTGIKFRRIAAKDQLTSDLAFLSAKEALKKSNLTINDIDLVLLATTTPDNTFPATATKVAKMLGDTKNIPAFDIQSVCSGYIFALNTVNSFIRSGSYKNILVIGSEIYSRILDWSDRSTSILFGDGSGSLVVSAKKDLNDTSQKGIIDINCFSNGEYYQKLYVDGGAASSEYCGHVRMNGPEVYKYAVTLMTDSVIKLLAKNNIDIKDINKLIPHQANRRIITSIAQKLDVNLDKVVITLENHANISAASLPVSLSIALDRGEVAIGDLVVLTALGGGFSWGSCLIRF